MFTTDKSEPSITTNTHAEPSAPISASLSLDPELPKAKQSGNTGRGWVKSLDALRGAAALYVVLNHVSVLTFIPRQLIHGHPVSLITRLFAMFLSLFTYGHQAVIIFFVLSGFCIHYRQAKGTYESAADLHFDTIGYYKRRAHRILPPYYFAIAYTAVCVYAFQHLNPSFAQTLTGYRFSDEILFVHNSLSTLTGNLFFLQWLTCPTYGDNTPLWSLSFEIFFYLLYPIYLAIWRRNGWVGSNMIVAAFSLACGIGLLKYSGPGSWVLHLGEYWIDWCLGCAAVEIYLRKPSGVLASLLNPYVSILLILAWLASVRPMHNFAALSDFIGAPVSVILVLTLLRPINSNEFSTLHKFGLWLEHELSLLGKFSYSLYLTHVPALALMCSFWFLLRHSFPTNPLVPIASVIICLLIARATYEIVEKRSLNH